MSVLKILTKDKIRMLIEGFNDPNKAIDYILSLTYNEKYAEKIETNLQNIKQHNFRTINEYYEELEIQTKELQKCNNLDEKQTEFFLKLKFKEGLSQDTKLALKNVRISDSIDALKYIEEIETQILINYKINNSNKNLNYPKIEDIKPKFFNKKWCLYIKQKDTIRMSAKIYSLKNPGSFIINLHSQKDVY
ncbi:hypothetical protein DMUE_0400 [Dictyocoela muelleri]|nr:hypothetical protein DMUE_0400 [Dictyocoela muelleri]